MLIPVYCLSGLGADERLFSKLNMPGVDLHYVKWQVPDPTDTLETYAQKLSGQIIHPQVILLGVSFGGMLASALLQQQAIAPGNHPFVIRKALLVSSCSHAAQLPWFIRLAGRSGLCHPVPYRFAQHTNWLNRFIFDLRSSNEELYFKRIMLQQTNSHLLRHAVRMIGCWKQKQPPSGIIHIHGTADKLLPYNLVQANITIEKGGHFMIWNRAEEISTLLNTQFKMLENETV
jgi:pimeloyl-ACP methyl ester carboxylesterase